jgi:predicted ATPase
MKELAAERVAVRTAVERLRLTPVLFELGARPHPPRELYLAYLEQSQVFVGIYGEQYGWVAPGQEVSGLEDEYAASAGKPRLVYIKNPAPRRDPRLAAMIHRIQSDGLSYRDFESAQELEQLVADDLAVLLSEHFQAPAQPSPPPRAEPLWALPVPTDSFVGRDRELRELVTLLTTPAVRLVTLVGAGGIGKTRLAYEVAGRLRDAYPDGIVAVPLADVRSAEAIPAILAAALGISERFEQGPSDAVLTLLRDRHLLLVLDNLEQIPAVGGLVAQLLSTAPQLTVLATSREVLRVSGEHVFSVPPLVSGAGTEQADILEHIDAVALFVDRARAARHDLVLDEKGLRTIADICRRLDGLPLAIELAAARVRVLGVAALLHRLDNTLSTLTGGPRDVSPRQRTLRNTLQWSYDLLTGDERALFARLAVFRGGFSLEAAEAICSSMTTTDPAVDVLDGIASLVDKSLVRTVDPVDDQARFALLEVVREFADERLAQRGEREAIGQAHADFFVALAADIARDMREAAQHPLSPQFLADSANFDAAMRWLLDHRQHGAAVALGQSLWQGWWMQSRFLPGMGWMEEVLANTDSLTEAQRANASQTLGLLAFARGDYERANPALTSAVQLHAVLGDRAAAATASIPLGLITAEEDPSAGHALLRRAVAEFRELHHAWGLAFALLSLGGIYLFESRYEDAVPLLEESIEISRAAGTRVLLSSAQVNLAIAYLGMGEVDIADRTFREALQHAEETGDREALARALEGLAGAAVAGGDAARGAHLFGAAAAVRRSIAAPVWRTDRRRHDETLAALHAALGQAAADDVIATTGRQPVADLLPGI